MSISKSVQACYWGYGWLLQVQWSRLCMLKAKVGIKELKSSFWCMSDPYRSHSVSLPIVSTSSHPGVWPSSSLIINLGKSEWSLSLSDMNWLFCLCFSFSLQNERDVVPAGEAALPRKAHHPENGDRLWGWRIWRPREHQREHVARFRPG